MLTNISIYWLTQSAGPAANFYYEGAEGLRQAAAGVQAPPLTTPVGVGCSLTTSSSPSGGSPTGTSRRSRTGPSSTGRSFRRDEEPKLLTDDIRSFFRPLA